MLHKLRSRVQDEKGFTLIELLVVILIIGILAAIALPAFLNQREKAQDSEAKTGARTVQTALETYYTDNQAYTDDTAALVAIEPAITQLLEPVNGVTRLTVDGDATTYSIAMASKGSNAVVYTIARDAEGNVSRTCDNGGKGSCPDSETW
jgi:type IV pilus assembly protein PilA